MVWVSSFSLCFQANPVFPCLTGDKEGDGFLYGDGQDRHMHSACDCCPCPCVCACKSAYLQSCSIPPVKALSFRFQSQVFSRSMPQMLTPFQSLPEGCAVEASPLHTPPPRGELGKPLEPRGDPAPLSGRDPAGVAPPLLEPLLDEGFVCLCFLQSNKPAVTVPTPSMPPVLEFVAPGVPRVILPVSPVVFSVPLAVPFHPVFSVPPARDVRSRSTFLLFYFLGF